MVPFCMPVELVFAISVIFFVTSKTLTTYSVCVFRAERGRRMGRVGKGGEGGGGGGGGPSPPPMGGG